MLFTVTKKRTVKAEQPQETVQEKPSSKIRSIDIYQAILKNNMLDRFKQVNESSEEFINRIRLDLKSNNAEIWIKNWQSSMSILMNRLFNYDTNFFVEL